MIKNKTISIQINEINKIEGHAGFVANLENGLIQKARLEVKEGARFIEGILVGRKYIEAPWITSRICGICPTVHNLTSIQAIEKALKIKPTAQTVNLRKLMLLGQIIQSHMTHIYFLALGDFYSLKSDLFLIKINPRLAKKVIQIRDFGNLILNTIGGRSIHPTTSTVGGFRKLPTTKALNQILSQYDTTLNLSLEVFETINNLTYIQFQRLTTFVSLYNEQKYPLDQNLIITSSKKKYLPEIFIQKAKEFQEIETDLIKKVKLNNEPYLIGALARLNLNFQKLNSEAKGAFDRSSLKLPCFNIFYNLLAQMIEVINAIEEVKNILSAIKIKAENISTSKIKAGQGLGVTEAPRGLLFHYYEIDQKGIIKNCNLVTPTAQFLANLEEDVKLFIEEQAASTNLRQNLKMLIRAYDPCITCAVH